LAPALDQLMPFRSDRNDVALAKRADRRHYFSSVTAQTVNAN
jgi:hypothetical protein